ncbi:MULTISPECIES: SufE family protein [unclassified Microbacterium]|uniref:SufE family protein n=1 Tax=unclassified Microbacterium TaxID=2609290 RepID=UPI0004143290|nr:MULTISPECIES: SufE family protein [unclassified Microbacterium]PQZ60962.1 cysteine desulfuration protein SufE [Microbacterium sp. MYb43]PQZ82171.1 cysteine desulfuration protein SufE [Microbacterium sp. MYb40]PRB24127.1 cysteine desulfuration protein SufE [Microbacterium sp. MYb54]PRB30958.1 cysteine desulfuration protein SufE [Microbacterium sp. MYb50]PRB70619.1 cysteine desulfuration protein SufE [Microbacterium sp. MYb24]
MSTSDVPDSLAEIRDGFLETPETDRLLLLLEFSDELPDVSDEVATHPEMYERVAECQSPVYIHVEVHDDIVTMHATAPPEAPTTRGFASILVQGLTGLTADEVLAIPNDYPQSIGLTKAVSPLRIGGMTGMLMRAKNQVRQKR